jgi:hypothetical protein
MCSALLIIDELLRRRPTIFQKHCGTGDEHAIADLICDLGHLADERGFDFLDEVRRACPGVTHIRRGHSFRKNRASADVVHFIATHVQRFHTHQR